MSHGFPRVFPGCSHFPWPPWLDFGDFPATSTATARGVFVGWWNLRVGPTRHDRIDVYFWCIFDDFGGCLWCPDYVQICPATSKHHVDTMNLPGFDIILRKVHIIGPHSTLGLGMTWVCSVLARSASFLPVWSLEWICQGRCKRWRQPDQHLLKRAKDIPSGKLT